MVTCLASLLALCGLTRADARQTRRDQASPAAEEPSPRPDAHQARRDQASPAAAEEPAPPHADIAHLSGLDERFLAALASGAIKLLDAAFLREADDAQLPRLLRRQDLESLEQQQQHEAGGPHRRIFLPADEAVRALRGGRRRLASLSYGWCSSGQPDPTNAYLLAVRRYLRHSLGTHILGLFWDFASLFQNPRTAPQDTSFKEALSVMGDVYASALAMQVIRHRRIPARPEGFDGKLVLLPPAGLKPSQASVADVLARFALAAHGGGEVKVERADGGAEQWVVSYAQHEQAEAAVAALAAQLDAEGGALFTLWNPRPYEGRGWTTFESAVTTEVVARASYFEKQRAALSQLPPKLIEIDGDNGPVVAEEGVQAAAHGGGDGAAGGAKARIDGIRDAIRAATFTGKGDKEMVVGLYGSFITAIGNAMVASGEGMEGEYEGEYNAAGGKEGWGTTRAANGEVYEGAWKADKREGKGTLRFADGAVYEGWWKAGEKEGKGIFRWADGNVYEGEWKADEEEGKGTFRWAAGDVYEGGHKAGKREGKGIFRTVKGLVLSGFYKADAPVGEGVMWLPGGQRAARARDGKPVEEISLEEARQAVAPLGLPLPAEFASDVYEGGYNAAGQREGWGTMRYATGDVYEGEWKAGEREGKGIFRHADGSVYEGVFKAGEREGKGIYRDADGDVYEGEFKAGDREGKGIFRHASGEVETGFYKANADVGEGVQWEPGGQEAWRLQDGEPEDVISLEEARRTVARLGLPLPAELAEAHV